MPGFSTLSPILVVRHASETFRAAALPCGLFTAQLEPPDCKLPRRAEPSSGVRAGSRPVRTAGKRERKGQPLRGQAEARESVNVYSSVAGPDAAGNFLQAVVVVANQAGGPFAYASGQRRAACSADSGGVCKGQT